MSDSTKQRLLVMNGQRLLQSEQGGEWATDKVDKAGALKPGIYDLHLAGTADKAMAYEGVVVYVDKQHVFQKVGKHYVKHDRLAFRQVPEAGASLQIKYDGAQSVAAISPVKLGRGLAR